MKIALSMLLFVACATSSPASSAPAPAPAPAPTPTLTRAPTPTPSPAPSSSNSQCAPDEALVQARYEPLCVTLCKSTPDCKANGPCIDATDMDGNAIKICEATGDPPKKKP